MKIKKEKKQPKLYWFQQIIYKNLLCMCLFVIDDGLRWMLCNGFP